MKVHELITALSALPQDHEVVMSSDAEGNRYAPLAAVHAAHYVAQTTWKGQVEDEDEDEEGVERPPNVVCFWPV